MAKHQDLTNIHVPHAFSYADATAREAATGFSAGDVGKWALQLDDGTYWRLTDDSPVTWSPVAGGSGIARSGSTADGHLAVWDGANADSLKDGGAVPSGGASAVYNRTATPYSTSNTSFEDVDGTNMAVTLTTGARRCLVNFVGEIYGSSTITVYLDIAIDGTRIGGNNGIIYKPVTGSEEPFDLTIITDPLTAGEHTIKLQWRVSSGTGYIYVSNNIIQFAVVEL